MSIPFTITQFLATLAAYNEAVWPMPALLALLGLAAVALAIQPRPWSHQAIGALLAAYWLWMGVAYHWAYFTAINGAAVAFGALFVAQGLLLGWAGVWRGELRFRWRDDAYGWVGVALLTYALVVYPALNVALGHAYPAMPTFGLPCPTTIFTFGLLLWAPRVRWWLVAIPFAWALVGTSAAAHLGIVEDYGLTAAGVVATAMLAWRGWQHHAGGAPAQV